MTLFGMLYFVSSGHLVYVQGWGRGRREVNCWISVRIYEKMGVWCKVRSVTFILTFNIGH